ncbi:hypothetical protein GWI33_010808, partial [Rhynchophorus ferrugineus]
MQQDSAQDLSILQVRFEQHSQEFNQQQQDLTALQQHQQQLQYQLEQLQKTMQRAEQHLQQMQYQQKQFQDDDSALLLDDLNIELASIQLKLQQYADEEQRLKTQWFAAETSPVLDWNFQGARQLSLAAYPDSTTDIEDHVSIQENAAIDLPSIDLPSIETWIKAPQHELWKWIYTAQNLDQAKEYIQQLKPQESIVTEDGFWLGLDWWVNLNLDEQNTGQGQLHYHLHLQELQQQLQQISTEILPLQMQLENAEKMVQQDQVQLQTVQQQLKQQQIQQQKLLTEQAKLEALHQSQSQNLQQIAQQIAQLQAQIAEDQQ